MLTLTVFHDPNVMLRCIWFWDRVTFLSMATQIKIGIKKITSVEIFIAMLVYYNAINVWTHAKAWLSDLQRFSLYQWCLVRLFEPRLFKMSHLVPNSLLMEFLSDFKFDLLWCDQSSLNYCMDNFHPIWKSIKTSSAEQAPGHTRSLVPQGVMSATVPPLTPGLSPVAWETELWS